jgi:hypothetical protein
MLQTPSKSTSSISCYTTPITCPSSTSNRHGFATPSFLRPTAQIVQSPQSPSLPWQRLPGKVKSFSALISDFKTNQCAAVDEITEGSLNEDDEPHRFSSPPASLGPSNGISWKKKGAKRTTRRVMSKTFQRLILQLVRPAPKLEIPASDDEVDPPALDNQLHSPASYPNKSEKDPVVADRNASDESSKVRHEKSRPIQKRVSSNFRREKLQRHKKHQRPKSRW